MRVDYVASDATLRIIRQIAFDRSKQLATARDLYTPSLGTAATFLARFLYDPAVPWPPPWSSPLPFEEMTQCGYRPSSPY
jgi:hypothetical protein